MRRETLDSLIDARCLLKHPFYQAWNMGTLTTENLGLYAVQYGEFIDRIAVGWQAAGDEAIAEEEREHARLWSDFAAESALLALLRTAYLKSPPLYR